MTLPDVDGLIDDSWWFPPMEHWGYPHYYGNVPYAVLEIERLYQRHWFASGPIRSYRLRRGTAYISPYTGKYRGCDG